MPGSMGCCPGQTVPDAGMLVGEQGTSSITLRR